MKNALIIGINGQDGTYLAEFLSKKKYKICGIINPNSKTKINFKLKKIINESKIKIFDINILNKNLVRKIIRKCQPNEIYYLASTHELELSYFNMKSIMSVNVTGLINIIETIRIELPFSKIFYASSSNIFSKTKESPQNEYSSVSPGSLYGISKVTAMNFINFYKEQYNLFICYGILYNHESILRKKTFLPMKIVDAAVNIKLGKSRTLIVGNLEDKRDWGSVEDFVKAMWMMLQTKTPQNYIIGTGKLITVKKLITYAFEYLQLDWKKYVIIDSKLIREKNSNILKANNIRIKRNLGWKPSNDFKFVIQKMIREDLYNKKNKKI